jgi:hypothetical protein
MTEKSKEETLRRKKRRKEKHSEDVIVNNLVAKNMNKYNKPKRHADLSKDHAEKDRYKKWKQGIDEYD